MSLQVLCGRSKSGKSQDIYKRIAELASMGKEVMLIVPEQFSHSAEKNLLSYVNAIKDNEIEVFSFNHLASITESRLDVPNAPIINSVGKAIIIKEILKESDFKFYKGLSNRAGFVDLVSSAICEFKKHLILPESLVKLASETDNVVLGMKLNDLSEIYSAYEDKISKHYRDGDDALTLLAKRIYENDIYNNKYVFVDGFSTFVPQELSIINALCNKCPEVVVSLCYDAKEKNTTLFMPTKDTLNKLKNLYTGTIEIKKFDKTYYKSDAIGFLEKNLYGFSNCSYNADTNDIKVYGMQNPLSEVEMCAYEIKNLVKEQGYMYRDIGVLCSDVDSYARHIERVFDQSDIEYFIDNKNDIINHHLIKFVLGILEVYINDYDYSSIFNYLKACFVTADSSSIAVLDKFIQKTKLKRATWLDDARWKQLLNANFGDDESAIKPLNRIRDKYILPLAGLHEKLKGRHELKNDVRLLYSFLIELHMPETISDYIQKFNACGEIRLAKEYEKIWDIIVNTFDELVEICGDRKVSTETFYELLTTGFSQHKVGFLPTGVDRVQIGNTERTRFENIKVLFVLGVNEGLFPVAKKPDGVLGDADKEAMKQCGCEFSTTSEIAAYYSQFSAYTGFTTPSEKLYISYCKADNGFKTMRKSYIVGRITKMFSLEEHSEASFDSLHRLLGKNYTKAELAYNYNRYISNNDIDALWACVYDYYLQNGDFADKLEAFRMADNYFNSLSDENIKALVPMLSYTSVSKLEKYMACKYAYFIDYVLRISPQKDDAVDAIDIGNLTHGILERLCKEFGNSTEEFKSVSDEVVTAKIDEYIDEYVNTISVTSDDVSPRDKYTLLRLKNSIFLCYNIIKQQFVNSAFEPMGYEIAFKDGSPLGAIEIVTQKDKRVNLTGIIDRADIYNADGVSYIRVIDYKTGYKEFRLDDVMYGLSLQLMVYLNKLVSSNPKYQYGGAWYFPVSDMVIKSEGSMKREDALVAIHDEFKLKGIVPCTDEVLAGYDEKLKKSLSRSHKNKRVDLDDFKVIDDYLKLKIGTMCDDIFDGDFEIAPCKKSGFSPCEYCKYNSICRFDVLDNEYRLFNPINGYDEIVKEMEAETIGNTKDQVD